MGLPVRFYSSDDAGAPVGQIKKPSDVIDILKACLVNGYGDKPPLGWSLSFEDPSNTIAVFRNSVNDGGSGGAVQVQAHTASNAVGAAVRFTAANQITAIDSFINKCGYKAIYTNKNNSRGWFIFGTSRGFYFKNRSFKTAIGIDASTSQYESTLMAFIGDIDSFIPNDMGTFTLITNHTSPEVDKLSDVSSEMQLGANAAGIKIQLYATDGSNSSAIYTTNVTEPISYCENLPQYDAEALGVPMDLQPCPIYRSATSSLTNPACRGIIPGLFFTHFWGFRFRPTPVFIPIDGENYYLDDGGYYSVHLYQITGEWYV
ncbi:hypothetical protein [Shewanella xiamenensis]|uniref:hypothetical protein n=2 Tax=Shewanella xiamenensis TaxID=332186 RepID=UPI00313CCED7